MEFLKYQNKYNKLYDVDNILHIFKSTKVHDNSCSIRKIHFEFFVLSSDMYIEETICGVIIQEAFVIPTFKCRALDVAINRI